MRPVTAVLVAIVASAAALAACGGGGTTLQGTFTDIMYSTPGSHANCAQQEFSNDPAATWKVRVTADNVPVGTTSMHWAQHNTSRGGCQAVWSMSVPAAQKAYQVTLIAACLDGPAETIASAVIQPSAAGQPVRFSDASNGGNNC